MENSHILIVDDNPEIREIIQILLSGEGFYTEEAKDGTTALSLLQTTGFDLIILDIMMPGLNGYQTCLEIRKITNAPILFLSAKTKDSDKALIRRYQIYKGKKETLLEKPTLQYSHLTIDTEKEEVLSDGQLLDLTDTEYRMLLLLIKNRKQLFSAERLYEAIWEEPYYYGANNTVMVHIRNLRRKVETDPNHPTIIKTVWGKGYRCD